MIKIKKILKMKRRQIKKKNCHNKEEIVLERSKNKLFKIPKNIKIKNLTLKWRIVLKVKLGLKECQFKWKKKHKEKALAFKAPGQIEKVLHNLRIPKLKTFLQIK